MATRRAKKLFLGAWAVVKTCLLGLLVLWATLAIAYSNLPSAWARSMLAAAFMVFAVRALWVNRDRRMRRALAAAFVVVIAWFISIRPSHDRTWRADVAALPRATIEGDRVLLTGFRNFDYVTRNQLVARYERRTVQLSRVSSVDFFISYWPGGGLMGHTFLSFNFDDGAPPVCVSIEVRPERGETFSPIPSMFKQYELIYVVGDERDLVRSRTNYRNERVYRYPIRATPDAARRLFAVYLGRINRLADEPEFYHLLRNNCTINIVRYTNAAGGQARFDVRQLLNGLVDQYLYAAGYVDTTLPFAELREQADITAAARAADGDPEFSKRIRAR